MLDRLRQAFGLAKQKVSGLFGYSPGGAPDGRTIQSAMQRLRDETDAIYSQAGKEILFKLAEFNRFHRDYEKTVPPERLEAWKRTQVYTGGRWENAREASALRIYDANAAAARKLNAERFEVYKASYNRTAYELDKLTGTRLKPYRGKNPLSAYNLSERKDTAWNYKKIDSAVVSGITSGDSLHKTAERVVQALTQQNRDAILRTARTSLTGADNAGREEAMRRAKEAGVNVKKMWIATLDHRTRDAHRELDGQVVDIGQPFRVYGDTIRYPGDPQAPPGLVYNCRCTLGYVYPDHGNEKGQRRDNETGKVIPYMTYREWEQQGGRGSSTGRRF